MKINIHLLIILILTLPACAVKKQARYHSLQTDSLLQSSRLTIQAHKIPESRASISVPATAIRNLPAGAAFIKKNGQATAEIRFLHDTLFVTATCDSLQSLVYKYEQQLEKHSLQIKETNKETKQNLLLPGISFIFFLTVLIVIYKFIHS